MTVRSGKLGPRAHSVGCRGSCVLSAARGLLSEPPFSLSNALYFFASPVRAAVRFGGSPLGVLAFVITVPDTEDDLSKGRSGLGSAFQRWGEHRR